MKLSRTAFRFMTAVLAASAIACGAGANEGDSPSTAEHKAYTLEQYRQHQAATPSQMLVDPNDADVPMQCSDVPNKCCTASGYCCYWDTSGSPICYGM